MNVIKHRSIRASAAAGVALAAPRWRRTCRGGCGRVGGPIRGRRCPGMGGGGVSQDEPRAELEAAGRRLAAADEERAAAMAEVTRLARLAKGELPIRQIAIVTGVTRQTVYTMLDDGEP